MACPCVGLANPAVRLSRVDLPQPLGPTRARNSPSLTSRSIPAMAVTSWPRLTKVLPTWRNASFGAAGTAALGDADIGDFFLFSAPPQQPAFQPQNQSADQ